MNKRTLLLISLLPLSLLVFPLSLGLKPTNIYILQGQGGSSGNVTVYNITNNITNNITYNITNNITYNITNNITQNITNNITNNITYNVTNGTGILLNNNKINISKTYLDSVYYPLSGNPLGFLTSYTETDTIAINIINSIGNWSAEKTSYTLLTYVQSLGNASNVNTTLNVQGLGFNTTTQLDVRYIINGTRGIDAGNICTTTNGLCGGVLGGGNLSGSGSLYQVGFFDSNGNLEGIDDLIYDKTTGKLFIGSNGSFDSTAKLSVWGGDVESFNWQSVNESNDTNAGMSTSCASGSRGNDQRVNNGFCGSARFYGYNGTAYPKIGSIDIKIVDNSTTDLKSIMGFEVNKQEWMKIDGRNGLVSVFADMEIAGTRPESTPRREAFFEEFNLAPAAYTVHSTAITVNTGDTNVPSSRNMPTTTTLNSDGGIVFAGNTATNTAIINATLLHRYCARLRFAATTDQVNISMLAGAYYTATTINMETAKTGIFWYLNNTNTSAKMNLSYGSCNANSCNLTTITLPIFTTDLAWHDLCFVGLNGSDTTKHTTYNFYITNATNTTVFSANYTLNTTMQNMPLVSSIGVWTETKTAAARTVRIDYGQYEMLERYKNLPGESGS